MMTFLDVYHTWNVLPMSPYMCYLCYPSIHFAKGGNLGYLLTPNPQIDTYRGDSWLPPFSKGGLGGMSLT